MALYHKYRPQKFEDVIAQEHIIKTLSNEVSTGKISHAYLFSGPRGTGKTTTARVLAKALNCVNRKEGDSEPCNSCNSCLEISESRSIDVIEIDAASHTGVDNVRENIIDSAQFRPTKSKFKIFIIDEAHMLSTAAFNALLKTLEEPPAYVVFILATTEFSKLPETIISRCQRFAFHRLPAISIKKYLEHIAKEEGVKIDKEVVERIVNKSEGAARDAISLLDQILSTGEKNIDAEVASLVLPTTDVEETLSIVEYLAAKNAKEAIILLNKLAEEGINLMQFSHDLLELLRLLLIIKISGQSHGTSLDVDEKTIKELKKLGEQITGKELVVLLDLIMERRQQIKTSPLPQLPLEMAIIEWCGFTNSESANNTNIKNVEEQKKIEEPVEKITLKDKVKNLISKAPSCSFEDITAKWPEFLSTIEKKFPSLAFILKMAELKAVEENEVQIAVGFSFHCDKLMEKTCQRNLEEALSDLYSTKIKIKAVVAEKNNPTADPELESIASSLGGEIL